jgi:glycosyltransferase involved in cell wall biosynthesis
MKILMVSDVHFPRVNGVSTSIRTFRTELSRLGHETTLIAPEYPARVGTDDDPDVLRVASWRVPLDPEDRLMRPDRVRSLLPRLRDRGFDLVHVQTPFVAHRTGIALARALAVPVIETYHTFFEEYLFHYVPFVPRAWMRGLARRFSRGQGNRVDALVVPSSPMRDALLAYGVTTPMHVLPTGIPLAQFDGGDGAAFRARLGIGPDMLVLLFVGRVAHEKNIAFLLRMFATVRASRPDAVLVIAGEGPAQAALRRLAGALGIADAVRFVGYLDRARALLDCYRAADAFVFASRTETQGLVLLEAMAAGVPVISTAVMGTRDIVGPRRGALVPDDDESDFARHVLRFAADPALRAQLAIDARAYVAQWRADALAARMAALYAQVIASGTSAARAGQSAQTIDDARTQR